MFSTKKISYVSGTRADFGLMAPILKAVSQSDKLDLQIYATGMHLMPQFGETVNEVKKLFHDVRRIEAVFETDDRFGMAKFSGAFLNKLVSNLQKDTPDFVLTLGDRVEMLATATACLYLGIPTGHIHGGEKTATVDEVARHAITKLSSLHFPATKEAAERIRRLGEEKWRIHGVGAPALDTILYKPLPTSEEVRAYLRIGWQERFILVAQHPVSEEWRRAGAQMQETLAAVKKCALPVVVVYPNTDAGGRKIIAEIEKEKNNPLFRIFKNIPYDMFLAIERDAAVWVGNSSAMMIESVSFRTPCVNIGKRQCGRLCGKNVIDVGYRKDEIIAAIEKSLHDKAYLTGFRHITNPWGNGRTARRVVRVLERLPSREKLLAKQITY